MVSIMRKAIQSAKSHVEYRLKLGFSVILNTQSQ